MEREWNPAWISWIAFHFIQATNFYRSANPEKDLVTI
jgi:hypothetical protein